MDDKVIQRIDGVLKLINKIRPELDGVSFEEFLDDEYLVDAISFRLSQIGEKMIKLEKLLGEKYPNIPWKFARKMRNIIAHDYKNTNPFIIYDTATNDLETLKNDFLKIRDDIKHISDLNMTKIWCGYYDGNDKSKKLQEKLGFAFCFSDEKLADLNTGAKCIRHINLLEKEKWEALK